MALVHELIEKLSDSDLAELANARLSLLTELLADICDIADAARTASEREGLYCLSEADSTFVTLLDNGVTTIADLNPIYLEVYKRGLEIGGTTKPTERTFTEQEVKEAMEAGMRRYSIARDAALTQFDKLPEFDQLTNEVWQQWLEENQPFDEIPF